MDHLLQSSVRSMLLAAAAALILWRVKSAAVRHAVWTLVTASMLVQIALSPLLPEIPLRVLRPAEPIVLAPANEAVVHAELAPAPEVRAVLSWEQIAAAVYFCGLLFFAARFLIALIFALRLVRTSEPAVHGAYQSLYHSHRVAAPLTIGNRILLPVSWRTWDAAKLRDVLAHEEAHVRRRDWAIAVMARLNRCVFWFHPLAWWLERQLARIAEQACDDAALAIVQDREQYARTLLDIARAIQSSKGRVLAVSNVAAPMAKEANVETRINRILDEARRIPRALGRRGWTVLTLLAAPLMYVTAAIQLAPAQTPVPPPAPVAPAPAPVAPAPAPRAAPAPPQPPAARLPELQPFGDLERVVVEKETQLVDLERKLEVARQTMLSAQAQAPQVQSQGDVEVTMPQLNRELADVQALLATVQEAMRRDQLAQAQAPRAPAVPSPPPPQARAERFIPTGVGAPIRVDVKTVRTTVISIPLDPTQQYDVIGRVMTPGGAAVMDFRDVADYRQAFEKNVSLKDGKYVMRILLRTRDGKVSTKEMSFEVK